MAQGSTIDRAVVDHGWERGGDGGDRRAAARLQPVNCCVCIKDGNAGAAEQGSDGRFAHADPTGQANHDHP